MSLQSDFIKSFKQIGNNVSVFSFNNNQTVKRDAIIASVQALQGNVDFNNIFSKEQLTSFGFSDIQSDLIKNIYKIVFPRKEEIRNKYKEYVPAIVFGTYDAFLSFYNAEQYPNSDTFILNSEILKSLREKRRIDSGFVNRYISELELFNTKIHDGLKDNKATIKKPKDVYIPKGVYVGPKF